MTRNKPVPDISAEDIEYMRGLMIYQDFDLIGFDKPSGLPVQDGRGIDRSLDSLLVAFARSNGKRPKLVHRLDAGTSGVIIVAKTQPAAAFFSAEFAERRTRKTYVAMVSGAIPSEREGVIDAPLVKVQEGGRARMIVARPGRKGAQSARTGWKVLAASGTHALIQLAPATGRMHQIRIHLAHLGCPILGDTIYGTGLQGAPRLMLHALKLEIKRPSGVTATLEAPLPDIFGEIAEASGLDDYTGL